MEGGKSGVWFQHLSQTMRERNGSARFGEIIRCEYPIVILEVASSRHEDYPVWSLDDAGGGKAGGRRGLSSWEAGRQSSG